MTFHWDLRLVVLSVATAIVGSFAALECAERVRRARLEGRRHIPVSVLGALLMGLAIWTMHFVGMLALQMPMPVVYSPFWSGLSMLAAAVGAGLAFAMMNQQRVTAFHLAMGSLAMGLAIATMHYLGMKSMRMAAAIDYEPSLFWLSILIAIGASAAALGIGYWMPQNPRWLLWIKIGSAIVMGFAISGMHYTGMAAARYQAMTAAQQNGHEPLVGGLPLRDLLSLAGIVFMGALIALTARAASDRERALDAYRKLAGELESRVRQRTAELEQINQELSAFSYSVSHDLRSPLRAIEGYAAVLAESHAAEFTPAGAGYLERIQKATMRMDGLLNGLLVLANVSRSPLARQSVDLSAAAGAILTEAAAQSPARKVEVVIQPGLAAPADPRLIGSALQNLLGNAWKFTAEADHARVEFGAKETAGHPTVYFVRDNGIGFDMAHAAKLFGMFERLHAGAAYEGQGIGLAVTKRIVERHGGRIWAEAAAGQGATIWFTLA